MPEKINTMTNIASSSAEQKDKSRQERISHLKEEIKKNRKRIKKSRFD